MDLSITASPVPMSEDHSNSLPLEVVQIIFDALPFNDLLDASLVCHRWRQAAETPITRRCWLVVHAGRINELSVLLESQRNYTHVLIHQLNTWEKLKPVLDVCAHKIHLRRLKIYRAEVDCLHRFHQLYSEWLEDVEEIHVSVDHRFLKHDACSGKCYTIKLPKAKHLNWSENRLRRGNRSVTISAPRLRKISVNDSFGSKLNLILLDCDTLESVECTLYRKNFSDIFNDTFRHLSTLKLRIYNTVQNVEFLSSLSNLTWLSLSLEFEKELLPALFSETFNAICECTHLEALQLHIMNNDSSSCCLNLPQLADALRSLQQLELNNMYLAPRAQVRGFKRLSLLKLSNVGIKNDSDIFTIDYPLLETISISVHLLPRLYIQTERPVRKLFVNLEALNVATSLDVYLVPFLQRSKHIRELVLFRTDCQEHSVDFSVPRNALLGIECLHLFKLGISLDSIKRLAECPRLKHLKLSRCTVGVGEAKETVRLDRLEALSLFWVQLDDPTQTMFPITRSYGEQLVSREEIYGSLIIFSTDSAKRSDLLEETTGNVISPV